MKETSGKRIHYKEPEGFVARLFWRLWMKFSVTFALSMMETWEIALIFTITGVTVCLVTIGLVRYFPQTITAAARRAQYYLSGSDTEVQFNMANMAGWGADKLASARMEL